MLHAARDCTTDPQRLLRNRTYGATPNHPSRGHASVRSLLRCSAYSPERTKLRMHCGLVVDVSQQMRGFSTGTSFSHVCDRSHIATPLAQLGRAAPASFKQNIPPGAFSLLQNALALNALLGDETGIPNITVCSLNPCNSRCPAIAWSPSLLDPCSPVFLVATSRVTERLPVGDRFPLV